MKKVELLAPAGNYEGLIGAVRAGADAIYLGGDRFGARAYAENFNRESLIAGIQYAHLLGRRIYLTVNTLVKEKEFGGLYDYLAPFYEAGLDGIIVQDIGVLTWVRERFPELSLHASTQMNVTHAYGAAFLRDLGVARVVPARELSLRELKQMGEKVDIEMETFIHGAMCYSFSGQCLFSSILGGRSGNRGRCAQPCRLPYESELSEFDTSESAGSEFARNEFNESKFRSKSVGKEFDGSKLIRGESNGNRSDRKKFDKNKTNESNSQYPLSMKDMCTIEILPELIEAGIHSFKIEGRMKRPEYAAGVTAIYRKYIDRYYEVGKKEYRVTAEDKEHLQSLYIRSAIGEGYYHRHNGTDMITRNNPAYCSGDENLLKEIRRKYIDVRLTIGICGQAFFTPGEPARLKVTGRGIAVTVAGAVVQEAKRQPLTAETVGRQLKKSGNTAFVFDDLKLTIADNAFMTIRDLNELRREAVSRFERELLKSTTRRAQGKKSKTGESNITQADATINNIDESNILKNNTGKNNISENKTDKDNNTTVNSNEGNIAPSNPAIKKQSNPTGEHIIHARITTVKQWQAAVRHSVRRIYVDIDLWAAAADRSQKKAGQEWFVVLPRIFRLRDEQYLAAYQDIVNHASCDGVLIQNIESYVWLKDIGYTGAIATDAALYIWNKKARDFWRERVTECCLPLELNEYELAEIMDDLTIQAKRPETFGVSCLIYGRIPMMVAANCITKTMGVCQWESRPGHPFSEKDYIITPDHINTPDSHPLPPIGHFTSLTDRYGKHFPVYQNCRHCYNIIYNSVPLSWHDKLKHSTASSDWLKESKVSDSQPEQKIPEVLPDTPSFRLDFTTETGDETDKIIACFTAMAKGKTAADRSSDRRPVSLPYKEYTTGHYRRGAQ